MGAFTVLNCSLKGQKFFKVCYAVHRNLTAGGSVTTECRNFEFSKKCDDDIIGKISQNMLIHPDFVSLSEEENLMKELELKFKRSRYQYDHWDDAIHGYRETEKPTWNEPNTAVITRLRALAFDSESSVMQHVHVLDLSEDGHIKPHLDSIKFCGSTIAGISLLSDSVMKLVNLTDPDIFISVYLPRRSLYIMKNTARYDYNHEILDNRLSIFRGEKVIKTRRVSVICRNQPAQSST